VLKDVTPYEQVAAELVLSFFGRSSTYGLTKFKLILKYKGFVN
jgi:hypothetical protein